VKIKLYLLLILSFTLGILLLVSTIVNRIIINKKEKELYVSINDATFLKANLLINYRSNNFKLDGSIILSDTTGSITTLNSICEKKASLIFYYPEEVCSSCFKGHFDKILEYVKDEHLEGIDFCIFTTFENQRLMKLFVTQNELDCDVYNIINSNSSFSGFPFQPLFFVLTENCDVKSICVLSNSIQQLTEEYLDIIRENL